MTRALYTVKEACEQLNLSRTTVFELIAGGELRSVLIGGRARRIPHDAIGEFVKRLEAEQAKAA